jgi:hypothetical protein
VKEEKESSEKFLVPNYFPLALQFFSHKNSVYIKLGTVISDRNFSIDVRKSI